MEPINFGELAIKQLRKNTAETNFEAIERAMFYAFKLGKLVSFSHIYNLIKSGASIDDILETIEIKMSEIQKLPEDSN